MKWVAIWFVLALAWASPSKAAEGHALTMSGLGPVKIGMTVKQAEAALEARLRMVEPNDTDSQACQYAEREDGRDRNVSYMIEGGQITRIDIVALDRGAGHSMLVRTVAGIGIGATERAVRRAYGGSLVVKPHPYDDAAHYLEVYGPGRKRALIFESGDGRVTSLRAGKRASVEYIEGCE